MSHAQEPIPVLLRPRSVAQCNRHVDAKDAEALVAAAYEFGFPLYEQARLTYSFSYAAANPRRIPVNTLAHARRLTGFNDQRITTPNNDTLYSSAAIDLSAGPVQLFVPAFGPRYYSISFFDAYTNVFACLGTRRHGGGGGRFLLVGPTWAGKPEANEKIVRAPGNCIVALARIQANGPDEYPTLHALQDKLVLKASASAGPRKLVPPVPDDPLNFIAVVNRVLNESPDAHLSLAVMENLARAGIGPEEPYLSEQQKEMWQQFYPAARARLLQKSQRFGRIVDGWEYTPPNIASFGDDYEARAVIALKGLWANIPAEQTYTFALTDADGRALCGVHHYRLLLPKELAEDGLFWSLSMYERNQHGQLFFRDNPLHRYALGSNTRGLRRNADGSIEITIAPEHFGKREGNWLPAPPGPYSMVMRVYLPKTPAIGTTQFYPPVERLSRS